MDVMRPKLLWVDGAAYRVTHAHVPCHDEDPDDFIREGGEDAESEEMISPAAIEEWKGKYRVLLDIPSALYGHLIGRKGNSLHMVQDNTGCKVTIPKGPKPKVSAVEVIGDQRRMVVRASNMLMMAADRGRNKLSPTHFVAARLATQHLQNRMETFKVEALQAAAGSRGVVPELFQYGPQLHLTLSMLTLLSETERQSVCRTLNEHADELRSLLPPSGLTLRVRHLDIMNDDWSEVRVLFARVEDADGSGAMQRLADRCQELVVSTGFGKKEYDHVKLHCTVMNVKWTEGMDDLDLEPSKKAHSTFDATAIMKELAHFDFGTVDVDRLEVVQREMRDADGFYLPIGSVSLKSDQ